jgi:uncharacterized protein
MTMLRRRRLAAAALCLLPAACSSADPKLYTIAAVSGATEHGTPKTVLVQQVAIARYLDRTHIVRSSQDYRVDVMSNDWWSETPGEMVSRVLAQELQERLPGTVVFRSNSPLTLTPDATVDVSIDQLDEDAAGQVVLRGLAGVTFKKHSEPVARPVRFSVTPPAAGTSGEVAAISTAVGQLADTLAVMLAQGPRR